MAGKWKFSSCLPPWSLRCTFTSESGHNLLPRDGVLPNPHPAGVVNGVGNGARHAADGGFAEALHAIEPARLQTVDVDLRRLGNVHDGRKPVGQVTDAVMSRARKFAVPGN